MLLGAKGFKDGFVDIWHSIQSALMNIFNSVLSAFVNHLLGGMLNSLLGKKGGFTAAFDSVLGSGQSGSFASFGSSAASRWAGAFSTAFQAVGWIGLGIWAAKKLWAGFGSADPHTQDREKPSGGGPDPDNPNNPYVDPETGEPYDPGNDFEEGQNSQRIRGYARGTYRLDFERFRPGGERVTAHNWESIIPKGRGHLLAAEIAAAMPSRQTGAPVIVNVAFDMSQAVVPDRMALEQFAERFAPAFVSKLKSMGLAT